MRNSERSARVAELEARVFYGKASMADFKELNWLRINGYAR